MQRRPSRYRNFNPCDLSENKRVDNPLPKTLNDYLKVNIKREIKNINKHMLKKNQFWKRSELIISAEGDHIEEKNNISES